MKTKEAPDRNKAKERSSSFGQVYEPSTIEEFWDKTSEDVGRTVEAEAQVRRSDFLRKKVLKRLSEKEKEYLNGSSAYELENILQAYFERASVEQTAAKTSNSKAVRAEEKAMAFLNSFHGYVEAYSGVIQIMNAGPGGGYGDAAYGALSLFLVVAVNKARTEELIDSNMHILHQQYCRIKMVDQVYNTDRMKELTAKVYRLGIEFLYAAVRYYSMSIWRRRWHVVARPPGMQLETKVTEVQAAIEDMRQEMRILDGIRLEKMETKLNETSRDVQALRTQVDEERLQQLQQLLGMEMNEIDSSLQEYKELLEKTFDIRNPAPFDVDRFSSSNPDFQAWRRFNGLDLLILRGSTTAPYQTDLSWLSSVAVKVFQEAEELFQGERILILRHFCLVTDHWSSQERKIAAQDVLKSLIFQILRDRVSFPFFRNDEKYAQTKHDIDTVNKIDKERTTEIIRRLYSVMQGILEAVKIERLVVIIDRLDQVVGDLEVIMDPLLDLISSGGSEVKVMITLRTPRSFKDARMKRVLGTEGYRILAFDQPH